MKAITKINHLIRKIPEEIFYTLLLFSSTRLVLVLIGVFSRISLEPFHGEAYVWRYSKNLWLDIWGVWDTGYYLSIAKYGYSAQLSIQPETFNQANYAFFPLYPLMMRVVGDIIGSNYVAGIILSNVFLVIASIFFYRLLKLETDSETAKRGLKYLFLFPTAFIFSGVFTESLFLMLLVLCFYFAKRKVWFLVGVFGFFLALTRLVGVLALVPSFFEYFQQAGFKMKKIRLDVFWLGLIPLGLGIFMYYNYWLTGDSLAFVHIQSAWGRELVNPFGAIYSNLFSGDVYATFLAGASLFSIGFLCLFYRKLTAPQWVLGLMLSFFPLFGGVASMSRYLLVIFPFYIIFAKLGKNYYLDQMFTILLALLQGFLMVFWSNGFNFVV